MSAVLVTGGSGYLGSILVRKLLERDVDTVVLENFTYGRYPIAEIEDHPRLTVVRGDICSIKDVSAALRGVSRVVALAAIVGDPAAALDDEMTLDVNYESTKVLVELCNRKGIERLLFASSCSVYGADPERFLDESSPLNPQSLYAETRIMSEEVIRERAAASLSPVIFRLATLFGWSHRPRFDLAVNILTAKAREAGEFTIFNGNQWRPFLHVADAADAFIAATFASDDAVGGETFNVGSNELNVTISQLGDLVARAFPDARRVDHEVGADRRDYRVRFDKLAERLPDLRLATTLERGIEEIDDALGSTDFDYRDDRHYNVEYVFK